MTFGQKVLSLYTGLDSRLGLKRALPLGVTVMNPYEDPRVLAFVTRFLSTFYADDRARVFVFGINPGRFGAGLTGVPFTDPVALEKYCGIPSGLPPKRELSSVFLYDFFEHWGGVKKFYRDFFLTAVSPLGFLRHGKNYNYYDDPRLFKAVKPFIVATLHRQLALGARREAAILLGTDKNLKAFERLNQEHGFFKKLYAVEHPRFIMQCCRSDVASYLRKYDKIFSLALA